MNDRIVTSLCILCALLLAIQRASAQGSLSPPGAPAPTMLTLSQVEPRTPITNTTAATISASGSYYLTGNIAVSTNNGITINASGVTLDLNGFTISSTAPTANGTGIQLASGVVGATILNGHIKGGVTYSGGSYTGSGFLNGIDYAGPAPANVHVSNVQVAGCQNAGIFVSTNSSTMVESCTVNTVGGVGISASTVTRSTAYQCGNDAIDANIASDCYGYSTGSSGLIASYSANNCYGISTFYLGLDANNANNCYGVSTGTGAGNYGLIANSAIGCYGQANSGSYGLQAAIAIGCYGQCTSGVGLSTYIANSSFGTGVTGLEATIANSCYSSSGDGSITYKYNMP